MTSNITVSAQKEYLNKFYVRCAITNEQIPLSDVMYWNVELQKPYLNPETVDYSDFYPHLVDHGIETHTLGS